MNLIAFFHLVRSNYLVLLFSSIISVFGLFLLIKDSKKEYKSKTVINTGVVSGYTILNHNSDSRIDREYTRSELQNLLALASSHETTEELSYRLLAKYLTIPSYYTSLVSDENIPSLETLLNEDLRSEINSSEYDTAYEKIKSISKSNTPSKVNELLLSNNSYFGIEHLKTIKKSLKLSSDLIEFSYVTEDPFICQRTLTILTDIFLENHKELKRGQSKDVLSYFEKATNESALKLKDAEDKLLKFRINNNIINYYEQTRFIADKKEDLDEYLFKEKMTLNAAQASKEKLDSQLESRGLLVSLNHQLLLKRDALSTVTKDIAKLEFLSLDQEVDNSSLKRLNLEKQEILDEMSSLTSESQKLNFTQDGLSANKLLIKWLESVISVEESSSRIEVIKERKNEFTNIYKKFAPWGSQLKKIEREIALAEDAYLENLHSYNQARLHLQNTIMSSNLKIMEAPILPIKPEKSKKILLLAIAFVTGFILPLSILIMLDFLDQTFKNPIEACIRNNLKLAGAFPRIIPPKNLSILNGKINYLELRRRSSSILSKKIILEKSINQNSPILIGIQSLHEKEGVSYLSKYIIRDLKISFSIIHGKLYNDKLWLNTKDLQLEISIDKTKLSKQYILDIIKHELDISIQNDIIILEIENYFSLNSSHFPWDILDTHFIVCKSTRIWTNADKMAYETINKVTNDSSHIIVNGVEPIIMENFIGEVPKLRSEFRKKLKSILMFNFSSSKTFSAS